MPVENMFYAFHLSTVVILSVCGVFIVLIKGFKPPRLYMTLYWFAGALLSAVNLFQTLHSPVYGQLLWNPLHVLILLAVYPLLFAYVFGLLRSDAPGVCHWLWGYAPVAVLTVLYFAFDAMYGSIPLFSRYAEAHTYIRTPQMRLMFAGVGLSFIYIVFYTAKAFRMMRLHKRNLESNFSSLEGATPKWIWWVIGITLFKWIVVMMIITTEGRLGQLLCVTVFVLEPVVFSVLTIRQKDLYSRPATESAVAAQVDGSAECFSEKHKQLSRDLLDLLENVEIFKDPELNADKVCAMLDTNRTYLWQTLKMMNKSFYGLVNEYRMKKSMSIMNDPQHGDMPLKTVAAICGFKTAPAFSKFFKQTCGKTPAEWRTENKPA